MYDRLDKEKNIQIKKNYLYSKCLSMFLYHNLDIPQEKLEYLLLKNGFAIITKVNDKLYAFNGGLGGINNAYDEPTTATVNNAYLNFNKTLEIDKDCIVIYNDFLGLGLEKLFDYYCTLLNENDVTIYQMLINKRIPFLISGCDNSTIESAKAFYKDVENGKNAIILTNAFLESLKVNQTNTNSNQSLKELTDFRQYLSASLLNEIGLNAITNLKSERLNKDEVSVNSDSLYPFIDNMLNSRRNAIKKINEMYGTNIEVEFNSSWDYRILNGEPIHNTESEIDESDIEETKEEKQDENK